jgi:hypothetical protein
MTRTFYDKDLRNWEAYVSGGQPGSANAARLFFVCRDDPSAHPRYARYPDGNVADAQRALLAYSEDELLELLRDSVPLELSG